MYYVLLVSFVVLLAGCDIIRDQLDGNQAPVIDTFEAKPAEGEAPLLIELVWAVADAEGDVVSCTLDFGDGRSSQVENCSQITSTFHTFTQVGGFTAILTATDGTSTAHKSMGVRTTDEEEGAL